MIESISPSFTLTYTLSPLGAGLSLDLTVELVSIGPDFPWIPIQIFLLIPSIAVKIVVRI